jgi:hypothetical protein
VVKRQLWPTVALLVVGVAGGACRSRSAGGEASTATTAEAWTTVAARLGNWPFVTPIEQLPALRSSDGETVGVRASDCGECHAEIYAEWQRSTHAAALRDLQYLAEITKPDSPRWLCLNCHIPVQNQRSYLVTPQTRLRDRGDDLRGLEEIPNPGFDRAMQTEAISCATCHVRLGSDGNAVVVGPRSGIDAPHPMRANPALGDICVRCHSPGPARLTPTFFCWFETSEELAGGPYAGKETCVDCHMPKDAKGRRQHHWVGGGVPKGYDAYDTLLARGWQPGLEVGPVEVTASPNEVLVTVPYANTRAGHWLPTGDPERALLLSAALVDSAGLEQVRSRLRLGQRWDWGDATTGRPARRLDDNRLRPKEERRWSTRLQRQSGATTLVITAAHVRLTPANARHMKATDVRINEALVPGVETLVKSLEQHYPLFTWVYREDIPLTTGARRVWTAPELLEASKASAVLSLDEIADRVAEK